MFDVFSEHKNVDFRLCVFDSWANLEFILVKVFCHTSYSHFIFGCVHAGMFGRSILLWRWVQFLLEFITLLSWHCLFYNLRQLAQVTPSRIQTFSSDGVLDCFFDWAWYTSGKHCFHFFDALGLSLCLELQCCLKLSVGAHDWSRNYAFIVWWTFLRAQLLLTKPMLHFRIKYRE